MHVVSPYEHGKDIIHLEAGKYTDFLVSVNDLPSVVYGDAVQAV